MKPSPAWAPCSFRRKAAGVVESALGEGSLNLLADCELAASVAGGPFKFTVTSPYMLARTLLDRHYGDFEDATDGHRRRSGATSRRPAVHVPADRRSQHPRQSRRRPHRRRRPSIACSTPSPAPRAVHLCFGNYGGQTIQKGEWRALIDFLNRLHVDHLVLEMAHRSAADLEALKDVDPRISPRHRRRRRQDQPRGNAGGDRRAL